MFIGSGFVRPERSSTVTTAAAPVVHEVQPLISLRLNHHLPGVPCISGSYSVVVPDFVTLIVTDLIPVSSVETPEILKVFPAVVELLI